MTENVMVRVQRRLAALLVALLLLLAAHPGLAAEAPPRVIELKVNSSGFNGQPKLTLVAEEDEMVELHLTYDDMELPEENPHQISIMGTDIESPVLDREHPTAVLRFRAGKVGTIQAIACKLVCDGHDNLNATLRIVPFGSAGGAAAQAQETQMALTTKPPATPEGKAELQATLTAGGSPLEGVEVNFLVRTTFVIVDWMKIGTARTDEKGRAVFQFKPNRSGDQTVQANFEGSGRYKSVEMAVSLAAGNVTSDYVPDTGFHIPGFGFWMLWVILGGIWLIFGYIMLQFRLIAANR